MVELVKGLEEQEYFHGFIRREEAEYILQKIGDYLVRCEMVQGTPSPVLLRVNNNTVRYLLCVLVELEPNKNAVAEWELTKTKETNKWRIGVVEDQKLLFDTIPLLIEEYSNPDKKLELSSVVVAELVKSGQGQVGKLPPPPQSKTIDKVQLKKCIKKPKWQLKAADVFMSPGPENLLGTGNYGYVQKGFYTLNGTKIPVAIKAIENKKDLASRKSQKSGKNKGKNEGGSQKNDSAKKKNDSTKKKNDSTRNKSAEKIDGKGSAEKVAADVPEAASEAGSKMPEKTRTMYSLIADTLKEAAAMRDLSHPNVVKMYGVVVERPPIMLVIELSGTSLRSYLVEKSSDIPLGEDELHNLAVQAAWGLEYLHSKQLIHRDLAARNCLVSEDEQKNPIVKISDFGLSRFGSSYILRGSAGDLPVKTMAPESLLKFIFTSATDVWSFGFLLYEIYTNGKAPLTEGKWNRAALVKYYNDKKDAPQELQKKDFTEVGKKIMTSCWKYEPRDRPTITEICRILEEKTKLKPPIVVPLREQDEEKKKIIESMKPKDSVKAKDDGKKEAAKEPTKPKEDGKKDGAMEPAKPKDDGKKDGAMEPSKEVGSKFVKEAGTKMSKEPPGAKLMSKEAAPSKAASKEEPKGSKEPVKSEEKKARPRTQRKMSKDPIVAGGSKEDVQKKTPSKEANRDPKRRVSRRIPRKQ